MNEYTALGVQAVPFYPILGEYVNLNAFSQKDLDVEMDHVDLVLD
jgi:hypothetical protein